MKYEKPYVTDLGSISQNTWQTPGGRIKGGGDIWHLDTFCEMSGCTSADSPDCINLCEDGVSTEVGQSRGRGR